MEESPGWATWWNLPPEMIRLISKNLADIPDFIRLRAVCRSWRSSVSISDAPAQIPWFLKSHPRHELDTHLRFYSLSSGKIYTLQCSNSIGYDMKGPSAHSYILSYQPRSFSLSLLNPLTNNQVPLPDVDMYSPSLVNIDPDPILIGKNLVLSGDKRSRTTGFLTSILAFYQPIENKWNVIEEEWPWSYRDAYYNGCYYVNDVQTKVIDVNTKAVKFIIPPPVNSTEYGLAYLIESSGEILRVYYHDSELVSIEDCHIHIHRLDISDNEKPCWVEIDSIGDMILFLDGKNGFSLCANNFKGFKGNSIYFVKNVRNDVDILRLLCRYDIEEGRAEALNCPFTSGGTWIVPSLQ